MFRPAGITPKSIEKTMKRSCLLIALISLCLYSPSFAEDHAARKASRYIRAYPDFFVGYQDRYLITRDGGKILFDDGIVKDYNRMVTNMLVSDEDFDPDDAFCWEYPAGEALPTADHPPVGDPGRIRPAAIFRYMYGPSLSGKAKMRSVEWIESVKGVPKKVVVTTINGADKALERVACDIRALPEEKKNQLKGIVFRINGPYGAFNRPVRDYPSRVSGHAYGIAVDINGNLAYFSGTHRDEPYRYRNNVPGFLVNIFEKHGFIWGGRWHSYDAMHFEYRPEMFITDNVKDTDKPESDTAMLRGPSEIPVH